MVLDGIFTYICELEFLSIIYIGNSSFSLWYVEIVVYVIGEQTFFWTSNGRLESPQYDDSHKFVDKKRSLQQLLSNKTYLFS